VLLANRANTFLTPVRTDTDLIVLHGVLFFSQPMFRQEFPERNGPIVSQEDSTIEILRVNLGYGLAAPPARCHQNPSFGYSHHSQNVPFSSFQHSATAATSAQNPNPHSKSMQMPV
jgi:hypothetical protein